MFVLKELLHLGGSDFDHCVVAAVADAEIVKTHGMEGFLGLLCPAKGVGSEAFARRGACPR